MSTHDIREKALYGAICECGESWYLPSNIFIAYRRREGHHSTPLGQLVREFNMEHRRALLLTTLKEGFFDSIPWLTPYADSQEPVEAPVVKVPDPDHPSQRVVTPILAKVYQRKVEQPLRGVHITEPGWYEAKEGKPLYLRPGFYVLNARGDLPKRVKLSKFLEDYDDTGFEKDQTPLRHERKELV